MRAILELIDLAVALAHLWKKRLRTHPFPQKLARFPKLGVPQRKTTTELCFDVRRGLEYRNTGCVRRVSLYQLRNVHEGHAKVVKRLVAMAYATWALGRTVEGYQALCAFPSVGWNK